MYVRMYTQEHAHTCLGPTPVDFDLFSMGWFLGFVLLRSFRNDTDPYKN